MHAPRTVAWLLVFVAPAAAIASWLTPRPALDRNDARETAVGALRSVGIDGVVDGPVEGSVHTPEDGEPVDVWIVFVDVGGEDVELRVQESVGHLVYVDDRIGPDDSERLLTDQQYEAMGDYSNDANMERWTVRNAAASVAGVVTAATSHVIARGSFRSRTLPELP